MKEDAAQLKDIAKGPGSFKDKAKAAVDAIKDPGEETPVAETASEPERKRRGRHRQGRGDGDPAV